MGLRILYLHPAPRGEGAQGPGASYPVLPVGAVGLCNRLVAAGHQVRGLNVPAERAFDAGFSLDAWLKGAESADLVMMDLHWAEHALGVLDAVTRVAVAWPGAKIVAGGLTATRFPEELLALSPALHGVVAGDAERPIEALAEAIEAGHAWPPPTPNLVSRERPPGPSWRTGQADYDALDTVELGWLVHPERTRRLLHSRPPRRPGRAEWTGHWLANGRGCAFECLYCGGSRSAHERLSGRKGLLKRAPEAVGADVGRLQDQGVHQIALTLDPDMLGSAHRGAFFAALSGRPGLYVESFQVPSLALLDALAARADLDHTELALTPLSGDLAVRRRNGKHYDDHALIERLQAAWARDISTFIFFSMNLPGEDERTLSETLALADRLLDAAPPGLLRVANICHTLDPASPMTEGAGGFGGALQFRRLADWVEHGRQPRPWRFVEGERGFSMPGRDLAAMVRRWDARCATTGGVFIPVPPV